MVKYATTILKFDKMGEKTGWTYIVIPADVAEELKPGHKQSFRVKGKLDNLKIEGVALLPMGDGSFIMALNADIRKGIAKRVGAKLDVQLTVDNNPDPVSSPEFMECLRDEPEALAYFNTLPKGHRNYFMKWIESAKTEPTKAKRIAQAVTAMARKWDYPTMIRSNRGT
ncbi:Bacteriocin-protection, YdeI or OmpD-Associated [Chitinophaga sp. CF118]|uniref:YdeI/OmpD-associated family protein n=1 Tax=Chitinophaga sp. CF118 TaxID=1884367 RepID=UPI0008E38BD5|nr:YdeI/OmpD-associated family protein [Chitinophaga sp. CF118]SFE40633.1 Bacteriocin-protection, YdeI or OmpD-Associated [Chitinophaga sp. CF118]